MKAGKCIVTLNVGTTNKIIKNNENGLIFDAKDIKNITNAIVDLIGNKENIKRLGNNAQTFANENFYDWEKRMEIEYLNVCQLLK